MDAEGGGGAAVGYSALTSYYDEDVVESYESHRFSGRLGRYRWEREQQGVGRMVDALPANSTVLDCPCGIGRWWPVLARRASSIIAADVSPAMLRAAESRVGTAGVPVSLRRMSAEALELEDASVDVVFSHALTKHLPIPTQYRALQEFSRVSRGWVLSSFSVFTPMRYRLWKRNRLTESFPLLPEQLSHLVESAGLEIVASAPCTTPVGVERSVLMRKVDTR